MSVVIPVLNGERHVEACLGSVLGQTYKRIEVVVADNASTDRTAQIVRSFADPRVIVLPTVTQQLDFHANWTRAVAAATGEIVKVVCHDDLLLPDCLSIQVALLQQHPTAVLACGRRQIIDDRGKVLIRARGLGPLVKTGSTRVVDGRAVARACARAGTNLLGEPANVLIRRDVLPEPAFDRRWHYTTDVDLYMRCLQGSDAVVDSRTVCCFRVSPHQLSAALASSQARESREFFRDIALRYPDDVSDADVRLGSARGQLLVQARRVLYGQMRMRTFLTDWRDERAREARA